MSICNRIPNCDEKVIATVDVDSKIYSFCQDHSLCESITKKGQQCSKKGKYFCDDSKLACGIHVKSKTSIADVKFLPKKKEKRVIAEELRRSPCKCNAITSKGQQCKRNAISFTENHTPVCSQHCKWNGEKIVNPVKKPNFAITDIPAIKRILLSSKLSIEDKAELIADNKEQFWGDIVNQNIYSICQYLGQSNIPDSEILDLWGKSNISVVEGKNTKEKSSINDIKISLQALLNEKKTGIDIEAISSLDEMFVKCQGFLSLKEIVNNVIASIYPNGINYHIAIQCWILRKYNYITSDESFSKFDE